MEYENSNTVLKPIATQSVGNEVIPHTPILAIASSQEGSQYHAQDAFVSTVLATQVPWTPILNICRIPKDTIETRKSLIIDTIVVALTKRDNGLIFSLIHHVFAASSYTTAYCKATMDYR